MNKKGQALIEFIIVLPVVIYIILGLIDFMVIFSHKNNIESKMEEVITLYKKDNTSLDIIEYLNKDLKNVSFNAKNDDKYTTIIVKMDYSFITPGLGSLLGDPYQINCERVILSEQ